MTDPDGRPGRRRAIDRRRAATATGFEGGRCYHRREPPREDATSRTTRWRGS